MRGIKSLNSYTIHFLINKFFIYKGDMSFKTDTHLGLEVNFIYRVAVGEVSLGGDTSRCV